MSIIGHLRALKEPENFAGDVSTLMFSLTFEARPAGRIFSESAPSHTLFAYGRNGDEVEVGSMWTKQISRGDKEGETFYTLSFVDPSLAAPINVAAFKSDKPGVFEISFRHRQSGGAKTASAA